MSSTPSTSGSSAPHERRDIAESFGAEAHRYDRARPTYPSALIDAIVSDLPGRSILDVGIGTGISSRQVRDAGFDVLGVEADPRMAEIARRRGFTVEVARFEDWDPAGRRFDAVIAGQTWHWIDPDRGATKAADVLHPGGCLALFWNVGDPEPDVAAAFAELYRTVGTDLPFVPFATPALAGQSRILTAATDGLHRSGAFTEPERWEYVWETTMSRDAWLDQVPTAGGHSRLPAAQLKALLAGMGAIVDSCGGSFVMHYTTVALVAAGVEVA